MKQALQLKLGQQLTLTPQLQQAIKLLQLSTLDLQQTITETLESNPLLDEEDTLVDQVDNALKESVDFSETVSEDIPGTELQVDAAWEDVMPSAAPSSSSQSMGDSDMNFAERDSLPETLQSHLLWQLNLTRFSAADHTIALAFIDAVDVDGRLTQTPEQIHLGLASDDIELDEIMAVLHRLQHFEPTGVFAADLRECLLIQLRQMALETPHRETAGLLVSRHIEQIPVADPKNLARRMRTTPDDIVGALSLIRSLNPTPGSSVESEVTEYIVPDVFVKRVDGRWRVELNPDVAPKLRINDHYAELLSAGSNTDKDYGRASMQEAKWFIKSLLSRNETLLKVASSIVQHQRAFLDHGDEAMRPLILADIAGEVDLHESTVSRATTRKYMHTPRGIYELKYFFSSHVATTEGGECSSTAIKALIKRIVAQENPQKPLSDAKLCTLLADEGVVVARRTIAKYREQMNIGPSNERKRYI
ncbi:MAG: RNA polymerase factor sigma-54 [Luminiphilus sp.]|nr:RNA polymerase factor sigma-54 [Luminiphilus sp.]MDG1506937.1 RNA polymerase factor sigma-54 [Luminiphilus sp.]